MEISIQNLTFGAIIGLLEHEKKIPQKIIINIKIKYDYDKDNFLDYAEVTKLVKSTIKFEKFELLEEALETLCEVIKTKFPQTKQIKLKILKPDILQDCTVGVKIKKNFKKN